MRSARFLGEGRITIVETEAPVPGPDEVIVDVAACALCGSDFRPLRQGWPLTPGHEIFGHVRAPGTGEHGKRVLVYIPTFCGHCTQCEAGRTNLCPHAELLGWQRPGGYAQSLAVPRRCLLAVPDDIPDRLAPLLLDVIGTTAHGIRLAERIVQPGAALVIGAGPIGLGSLLVLQALNWGPVFVCEPNPKRAAFAASLNATVLSAEQAEARQFPLVIEASGKDAGRALALTAVAQEGAAVQLGESDQWSITETRALRRKDYFLIRSFYFPLHEYAANIELLRANMAQFAKLVDATADLDGLETLFAEFARGERLKPLLCPV
ncbi:MAG: alcohol dehydrogenase catalytic domain-containing protein [Acidocella sp.]|nr:alcohol dehydrogenase catalytic domain-containing protein [Acidocella sp.]